MRIRLARLVPTSGTLVGLLLTALVWLLFIDDSAVLHRLELLASDLRFRIRGPKSPGPEVVIAAIDEKSIDQLGRWPWPFTIQARLIDRLTQYGAAAIGYDVVFSSSDTSAGLDNLRVIKQKLTSSSIRPGADVVGFVDQALAEANHDQIFADALRHSGRAVLGYFIHFDRREVAHLQEKEMASSLADIRHCKYNAVTKGPGVR